MNDEDEEFLKIWTQAAKSAYVKHIDDIIFGMDDFESMKRANAKVIDSKKNHCLRLKNKLD